jgi:hypothetical protein
VTDNYQALKEFAHQAERLLFKWLNRRGGKHKMTWNQFDKMARKFPLPKPRIHVNLFQPKPVVSAARQQYLFPSA